MSKPDKQKESGNEKFLRAIGETQISASSMFDDAHASVLKEAKTDQTDLFRGRLAGDAWQQLGGALGTERIAQGDARRAGAYEGLAKDAMNSSLREGTRRGMELRDERIHAGATSRLSNVQRGQASIQSSARTAFEEAAAKTKAANDLNNEYISAGLSLAGMAAGSYMGAKPSTGGFTGTPTSSSATAATPYNQSAMLQGRPVSLDYSPVDPYRKLYGANGI